MSETERQQTERYYLAYQRAAAVCLLAAVGAGGYFLVGLSGASDGGARVDGALVIVALFLTALLAVTSFTLRGRLWRPSDPAAKRVLRDEWTRRNWSRASRNGFAAVMWAQLPLAFLMNRLAAEPSYVGMAGLSMTLGIGAFWATYLYLGRQQGDG